MREIVTAEGEGAFYLFDCLSDLLYAWATDLMIGNFFMVTCPYLFKLDTVAYFAILRNNHSFKTIARIRETTQLLLDVYNFDGAFYVHPLKVWNRYSPTMFLPHLEKGDKFVPITNSVDATRLFSYMSDRGVESAERNLDYWDRLFLKAEEIALKGTAEEQAAMLDQLCKVIIGREPRMLALAKKNLNLADLLSIKSRMIGTGFIGGKAVGMLLARKILANEGGFDFLEPHDSFFIGSDIFYSYIVENGLWEKWLEQRSEQGYFEKAAELKDKLLKGQFPDEIREQFQQMLEYFGQSPIIVRSSSLLEDSFGNAFAGKYESIFCVNQGSPDQRYANYESIVRRVFASTMNEDALMYRLQRGLSQQDEQMALLVQRVSGTQYKHYYFPYLAGVGVSYNSFVWHEAMDPRAGLLRLVFGLGTRAVNRVEGDYPRNIALDEPLLKPYAGMEDERKYSQHDVDLLNIEKNELQSLPFSQLLADEPDLKVELVAKKYQVGDQPVKVLTFDDLISKTSFIKDIQRLLKTLEKHYEYPVDIEYTVNFTSSGKMQVNLVQCRPLQAKGEGKHVEFPKGSGKDKLVFSSSGNFMGGNVSQAIKRIIYVDPKAYGALLFQKKFEIARLIGRLNRGTSRDKLPVLLIGPGRWGTRDATLGVPVSFAEISNFAAMAEVADPAAGFNPDLSFGSHFFLDLVEANIFYLALFTGKPEVFFNHDWLERQKNILPALLPEEAGLAPVIRICDCDLRLFSDIATQQVILTKM